MPDLYTNGHAVDIIEDEGLSCAVQDYCDGSVFKDPQTAAYWNSACAALDTLCAYLASETGRYVN